MPVEYSDSLEPQLDSEVILYCSLHVPLIENILRDLSGSSWNW